MGRVMIRMGLGGNSKCQCRGGLDKYHMYRDRRGLLTGQLWERL